MLNFQQQADAQSCSYAETFLASSLKADIRATDTWILEKKDTGNVHEIKHRIKQDVQRGRGHEMDTHSAGRRRREGYLMRSIRGGGWEPSVFNFDSGTCT